MKRLCGRAMTWLAPAVAAIAFTSGSAHAQTDRPTLGLEVVEPTTVAEEKGAKTAPEAKAKDAAPEAAVGGACDGSCCGGFDFSKVPPVRIIPRPGNFPILPSGPGYYSLLDVIR